MFSFVPLIGKTFITLFLLYYYSFITATILRNVICGSWTNRDGLSSNQEMDNCLTSQFCRISRGWIKLYFIWKHLIWRHWTCQNLSKNVNRLYWMWNTFSRFFSVFIIWKKQVMLMIIMVNSFLQNILSYEQQVNFSQDVNETFFWRCLNKKNFRITTLTGANLFRRPAIRNMATDLTQWTRSSNRFLSCFHV